MADDEIQSGFDQVRERMLRSAQQLEREFAATGESGLLGSIAVERLDDGVTVRFIPARSAGGPVEAGQTVIIGVDGPELLVPAPGKPLLPDASETPAPDEANG